MTQTLSIITNRIMFQLGPRFLFPVGESTCIVVFCKCLSNQHLLIACFFLISQVLVYLSWHKFLLCLANQFVSGSLSTVTCRNISLQSLLSSAGFPASWIPCPFFPLVHFLILVHHPVAPREALKIHVLRLNLLEISLSSY